MWANTAPMLRLLPDAFGHRNPAGASGCRARAFVPRQCSHASARSCAPLAFPCTFLAPSLGTPRPRTPPFPCLRPFVVVTQRHPSALSTRPRSGNTPPAERVPGRPCALESRRLTLPRADFAGQHTDRESNTIDQLTAIAPGRKGQTFDLSRPPRAARVSTPRRADARPGD